jgi:lysophospholipase L1-like esterase
VEEKDGGHSPPYGRVGRIESGGYNPAYVRKKTAEDQEYKVRKMEKGKKIVAFGDSITQAAAQSPEKKWCAIVEKMLREKGRQCEVINAGVGGNTSREGLARFEKDVLAHKPDMVLIEFGGNDATNDLARRVELGEFNENLKRMLAELKKQNAKIVMLTFPPIIDEWHDVGKHDFFQNWGGLDGCIEEYREAVRRFAKENGLRLADIDQAIRKEIQTQEAGTFILRDGVHLTDEGNEVVARVLSEVIGRE